MARLPQPGSDDGTWGTILNEFLSVSLNTDGSIKDSALTTKTSNSAWTQKGDILVAADENLPSPVTVGSDGQVLTADQNEPTGVKWATPAQFDGNELAWNGTDYVPVALKADTSRPRTFKGPVNPSSVSGVVMSGVDWFDTWVGGS